MRVVVLATWLATWMSVGALVLGPAAAVARPLEPAPAAAKPEPARAASKRPVTRWSQGVSDADQARALQLFQQGNVFFEQAKYTEAVAKYELAISAWDHPNIRFNMAICLINMRQPLVAWSHLTQALRFGDAPLGKRLYAEAMTYRAALEASLGELTVKTSQPDVKIMVDGGQIQVGLGEHTTKLLAGRHQVVATRAGYVTYSRAVDLPAGVPIVAQIELQPERVRVEVQRENYERRWRWYTPWAVTGSAVAVGVTGAVVYLVARSQIRSYDKDLADLCPAGCSDAEIPAALKQRASSARRTSGIGVGLFVGAGALAITSGVMAILNRPRKVEDRGPVPLVTLTRDQVGVGLALGF